MKQLVWILTVSNDGAVPMAYRLFSGDTSDDPTHVPTWDGWLYLATVIDAHSRRVIGGAIAERVRHHEERLRHLEQSRATGSKP